MKKARRANGWVERGAALPLALFLFLICSILASIVLAASTAAAGRYSQLTDNDQRYYSVISAAGLMKEEFAKPVTFEIITETTSTQTVTTPESQTPSIGYTTQGPVAKSLKIVHGANDVLIVDGGAVSSGYMESKLTVRELAALYALLGTRDTSEFVSRAADYENNNIDSDIQLGNDLELIHTGGLPNGATAAELKVLVEEAKILRDSNLQFRLSSTSANDASNKAFSLTMIFTPTMAPTEGVPVINTTTSSNETTSADGKKTTTETTTTIEKRTVLVKVSWTALDLVKGGA